MKGKTYDLKKLSGTGMFDTSVVTKFYYTTQEYFDALTDFVKNYRQNLGYYTPAFVVNSTADREEFLRECFDVRATFVRLGLTALSEALSDMENAGISKNYDEFKDGQIKFHATMKICKSIIKDSEMRWKITIRK